MAENIVAALEEHLASAKGVESGREEIAPLGRKISLTEKILGVVVAAVLAGTAGLLMYHDAIVDRSYCSQVPKKARQETLAPNSLRSCYDVMQGYR